MSLRCAISIAASVQFHFTDDTRCHTAALRTFAQAERAGRPSPRRTLRITGYLALEKLRFQERLVIEIDSPVELEDALVPTLILHPLVENAIRHGVGARDGQGKVSIRASRSGDLLRLEVTDNGPGLSAGSPLDTASGIGLLNSRERLAQLYGSAATLNVVSTTGGGVMATVRIPLRTIALTGPTSPHLRSMSS